jgi:hypothetical protein
MKTASLAYESLRATLMYCFLAIGEKISRRKRKTRFHPEAEREPGPVHCCLNSKTS